jgi:hypothetical protein
VTGKDTHTHTERGVRVANDALGEGRFSLHGFLGEGKWD